MTILLTLLGIVAPVFIVIGSGYTLARIGYFTESMLNGVVRYAVGFAVPVLLFLSMTRIDLSTALDWGAMLAFFGAGNLCFLGAYWTSRLVWKRRPGEAVAQGFCTFFPNVVMLGIPIAERAFGPPVMGAVFGIIAVHSIHNYLVGFVAMEMVRSDRAGLGVALSRAAMTTFRNPLMIGLVSGMAWNLTGLTIPAIPLSAIEMVAGSAIPAALFSLGGVLTRYRFRDEAPEAMMVVAFSLLVHPALAWTIASLILGLDENYVRAVVLLAAMTPGLNGYIFAALYDRSVGVAASASLLGTMCAVGTITLWLAFLGA